MLHGNNRTREVIVPVGNDRLLFFLSFITEHFLAYLFANKKMIFFNCTFREIQEEIVKLNMQAHMLYRRIWIKKNHDQYNIRSQTKYSNCQEKKNRNTVVFQMSTHTHTCPSNNKMTAVQWQTQSQSRILKIKHGLTKVECRSSLEKITCYPKSLINDLMTIKVIRQPIWCKWKHKLKFLNNHDNMT